MHDTHHVLVKLRALTWDLSSTAKCNRHLHMPFVAVAMLRALLCIVACIFALCNSKVSVKM